MKNILFSLLILSSSFIYSTDFKIYEEEIDLQDLEEEAFLNDISARERYSSNGWKVLKGLVGLCIGTKLFFSGGTGFLFMLMSPDDMLSRIISQSTTLTPVKKILTNRLVCLSLCSTLIVFSLWVLKKSADSLYQGLYATEKTIDVIFETDQW